MWLRSIKLLTWVASIGLVVSALFIAFVILFPVDVLTNWKIRIAKDHYTLGETVVIESLYTKNIESSVHSVVTRYLECKNGNGVYVRYELNQALATAPQNISGGTGIIVKIPEDIAEVDLPTDCYFAISVDYDISPRRAKAEYNRSQNFVLSKPKVTKVEQKPIAINPTPQISGKTEKPEIIIKDPVKLPAKTPTTPVMPVKPVETKKNPVQRLLDPIFKLLGVNQ